MVPGSLVTLLLVKPRDKPHPVVRSTLACSQSDAERNKGHSTARRALGRSAEIDLKREAISLAGT